jgi:hypothetical protein
MPRIQIRRDNASVWAQINPILFAGEFGLERDTLSVKIGDGVTRWNALPYVMGPEALLIANASDAELTALQDGNLLRYENGKWRNSSDVGSINGGNF